MGTPSALLDKRVWGREGLTLGLLARLTVLARLPPRPNVCSFRMVELFHNAERKKSCLRGWERVCGPLP